MANIIKPKRSSVAGKVPTNTDIVNGEIAINSTDQKIYTNAGGTVTQIGAGVLDALGDVVLTSPTTGQSLSYNGTNWVNSSAGAGDVVGAASSTDNALVRFDGTTGKLIQNGNITQDDNGNLANVNAVGFDTTPGTLPTAAGSMFWDAGNGSPSIILDADVTLQLGQEQLSLVYNGTGSTIANGSIVAVTGGQGQRPSVALADADSELLSANTLGIATEDIANGAEGFVTTFGYVRGIDTSAFTAGAPIYLSQTAGQFTATRPSAPAHTVALGWVIKVNASSGEIFVNINNGWELDELHNVLITSPTSGNTLIYDAVAGVWKNANITAGTGITITNGAGSITAAIDSTVATLTGTQTLTNKTISGASNTLSNIDNASLTNSSITINGSAISLGGSVSVGTVTSVTGTSPVVSSGGTTPAISLASGYGDTQNPYASKTANYVLAAPNGTAGVPTFRAIVAADIPTLNQNTTGTASNVTGTVAIANGGTGATTAAGALTNLGAYAASNPSGYTSNTGTVTSVSGTGTASGLSLSGTVTTSGNITLSGTVNSLAAGTYEISISGNAATATTASNGVTTTTGSPAYYGARAWVNCNNGSIRASVNVSSVSRTGTGAYTVNFSTAMPDANYACVGLSRRGNTDNNSQIYLPLSGTYSTTACQIFAGATAQQGTGIDSDIVNVVFFR